MRHLPLVGRASCVAVIALGLAAAPPAAAKSKTPKNVKVVARNYQRGVASPDGTQFLYDRGPTLYVARAADAKVVQRIKLPKTRCGSGYCNGMGVIGYAWSPDGKSIAYSIDTGRRDSGLYRYDLRKKKARRITDEVTWEFGFDSTGALLYMTGVVNWGAGRDAAVWRAGESKPFLTLPNRADKKLGTNGHMFELRRSLVLTTVKQRHAKWELLEIAEVWITELSTGKASRLAIPRGASGVTVAPGDDRVCYYASSELHCLDPSTGDDVEIMGKRACGWGESGIAAWSPSGRRLAFAVCKGSDQGVAVVDFGDGTTNVVLEQTPYRNFAFQTESALLLLKSYMPKHSGRTHEGVARVDVDTGELFGIVADDTQYPYAFTLPGRDDVTYVARDREGTTDLAWIDTRKPIGPAPTMAKPVTGNYIEYHANGTEKSDVQLRGGVLHGKASLRDWDGKPLERGSYHAGKKTGAWTTWFPSGRKESVVDYDGDKRHGDEIWYWRDTGAKSKVMGWKHGLPHGQWRAFYLSGKKAGVGQYRDGIKLGTWTRWHEDGTKREQVPYVDGKKNGVQKSWWRSGKLSMTGENIDGKRQGRWLMYNSDGTLWREVDYVDGRKSN